jgi:hypothetical protein
MMWRWWFFFRGVEGSDRPIEPLLDRIKYSPLSPMTGALPEFVLDLYYEDCKRSENWPKVIGLLKAVWDREIFKLNIPEGELRKGSLAMQSREYALQRYGNAVGIPLIEAYLHDGMPRFADEVFNTWLDLGGKFADISKIVQLAKEKGHEGTANGWEVKISK